MTPPGARPPASRSPRLRGALLLLAALAAAPLSARAQAKDPAAAAELFNKGREAMKAGDFATACPRLAESQELDPKVGTLLNLAECEEHIGKLLSARLHWQQAYDRALAEADMRAPLARERLEKIDRRVPKLTIKLDPSAPADTTVERDGVTLTPGAFGVALPLNPGPHALIIKAPGWEDVSVEITLAEGESQELRVAPKTRKAQPAPPASSSAPPPAPPPVPSAQVAPAEPPPRVAPPPPPPPPEPPSSDRRTIGRVLLIGGGAGVALGLVAGALVLSAKSTIGDPTHCVASRCDKAGVDAASSGKTWSAVSTISFFLGVGAAAGGLYLVLSDDGPRKVTAGMAPTPGGLSTAFAASF